MKEIFQIERTEKHSHPALWEEGRKKYPDGESQIICGPDFEKKIPVYLKIGLEEYKHALFVLHKGDHLVRCKQKQEKYEVQIFQIQEIMEKEVVGVLVGHFKNEEWLLIPPSKAAFAIEAAKKKADSYIAAVFYALKMKSIRKNVP